MENSYKIKSQIPIQTRGMKGIKEQAVRKHQYVFGKCDKTRAEELRRAKDRGAIDKKNCGVLN